MYYRVNLTKNPLFRLYLKKLFVDAKLAIKDYNFFKFTSHYQTMEKKPLILVTNDDGITAPGIRKLIQVMNEIGDVVVIAPDSPQSAMGHAITINSTLHCTKIDVKGGTHLEYSCSGTPADCVKLGVNEILDRKPDLCVSGINHGSNSSINVVLNVNFPKLSEKEIKGIKICRQARAYWIEEFDKRTNPMGQDYYWLTGKFVNKDKGEDTDEWALSQGFISVVPIEFDLTAHHVIQELNTWNFDK